MNLFTWKLSVEFNEIPQHFCLEHGKICTCSTFTFQNILLFSLTFTKVKNWSIATHQTVQTADCKTLTGNMWLLTAAFTDYNML